MSITYRSADISGIKIFYREAGNPSNPTLLLLHGFPSSSHMFRDLIPLLAERYHLVAPDFPGFGQSHMPDRIKYQYTFANLAETIAGFTESIGLKKFAIYIFDYGSPVGLRLALKNPDRISAIISQNGNAYEEGLSNGWDPIRAYWKDATQANRDALRAFLTPETTTFQYTHGGGAGSWPGRRPCEQRIAHEERMAIFGTEGKNVTCRCRFVVMACRQIHCQRLFIADPENQLGDGGGARVHLQTEKLVRINGKPGRRGRAGFPLCKRFSRERPS